MCPSCGAANTGSTPGYPTYGQQPPPPRAIPTPRRPPGSSRRTASPATHRSTASRPTRRTYGQPQQWSGPPPASTGARIGAYLLDWLFTVLLSVLVSVPIGLVIGLSGGGSAEAAGEATSRISQLVGIVIFFGYFAGSTALWGRTLGKRIVGLRVVNQADGRMPSSGQALGRYGILFLLLIPCGIPAIICAATLGSHPLRQGWHDRAASTMVLRA